VKPQANNILVPVEIHENVVPMVTWAVLTARALRSRLPFCMSTNPSNRFNIGQLSRVEASPEPQSP